MAAPENSGAAFFRRKANPTAKWRNSKKKGFKTVGLCPTPREGFFSAPLRSAQNECPPDTLRPSTRLPQNYVLRKGKNIAAPVFSGAAFCYLVFPAISCYNMVNDRERGGTAWKNSADYW